MRIFFATSSYVPPYLNRQISSNKILQILKKKRKVRLERNKSIFSVFFFLSLSKSFFLAADEEKAIFVHRHPLLVPYLD